MNDFYQQRIEELEARLEELPKGTLVYKNIRGNKQPYLQWTENGHSVSAYIKVGERDQILLQLEERSNAQSQLRRLKAYYEKIKDIAREHPYLTAPKVAIGQQYFDRIIEHKSFYIDKTRFLREWWEADSSVTLITRPRRFGKTLTLSMTECFFSTLYKGRSDLFENLEIWKDEQYRELQGTYPTIFMTFAAVKSPKFDSTLFTIGNYIEDAYSAHQYLSEGDFLSSEDKNIFKNNLHNLRYKHDFEICVSAIKDLCMLLEHYHHKKVLLLIDEYDTPLQESFFYGYWDEMIAFMREFFNASLKSNPHLEKALLTGITRVSKESVFSDLNHLSVNTVLSEHYADIFGFTEPEVVQALRCQDSDEFEKIKTWYDGFTFGSKKHIYNPWSITNYIDLRKFKAYWVNTSGNELISKLVLHSESSVKEDFHTLLRGGCIQKTFHENVVFHELYDDEAALWSFLLATGYLRADNVTGDEEITCDLSIVNHETMLMFEGLVKRWFGRSKHNYHCFCKYLMEDDLEEMNDYLSDVLIDLCSFFDTAGHPSEQTPERFYHGLVLGMIVDLQDQYEITSNRESGHGRYDIMMRPRNEALNAIIIEFKIRKKAREKDLEETARNALNQIEKKAYASILLQAGIPEDKIHKYGFAFEGKEVLIIKG